MGGSGLVLLGVALVTFSAERKVTVFSSTLTRFSSECEAF